MEKFRPGLATAHMKNLGDGWFLDEARGVRIYHPNAAIWIVYGPQPRPEDQILKQPWADQTPIMPGDSEADVLAKLLWKFTWECYIRTSGSNRK
jgi:hypothetical protein